MYFQDLIMELQRFWSDWGCAILQPYDMEVGAGTSSPATFLGALGPMLAMWLMFSHRAVQQMGVMVKTRIVCSIFISLSNFKNLRLKIFKTFA